MSTTIYQAFCLPDMPVGKLQKLLRQFRTEALVLSHTLLAAYLAKEAAELFDRRSLGLSDGGKGTGNPLATVYDRFRDDWRDTKEKMHRHPSCDVECDISFMPLPNHKLILGIVHAEQNEHYDLWMKLSKAQPFDYWNNTDRPDDVTAADWRRRKTLWDKALPGAGVPLENGFSFTLIGRFAPYVERERIVTAQPSLDKRARLIAQSMVLNELTAKPPEDADEETVKKFDWSRAVMDAFWQLREDDGQRRWAEVTDEVKAKLKPVLDINDFLGKD
jgi:hypothetical protein